MGYKIWRKDKHTWSLAFDTIYDTHEKVQEAIAELNAAYHKLVQYGDLQFTAYLDNIRLNKDGSIISSTVTKIRYTKVSDKKLIDFIENSVSEKKSVVLEVRVPKEIPVPNMKAEDLPTLSKSIQFVKDTLAQMKINQNQIRSDLLVITADALQLKRLLSLPEIGSIKPHYKKKTFNKKHSNVTYR